jgi:hypothetical protein
MKPTRLLGVMAVAMLAAGCMPDLSRRLVSDAETQTQVLAAIESDSTLSAKVADHLFASDAARPIVLDRLNASGEAMQDVLAMIARNPTRVDAVVGLAVQDTTMRERVLTLFKGIQMGDAAR